MTPITHYQHHATVVLDGDIEWSVIHDLVHAIETAVDYYCYACVEIQVRSLGGSNDALRYLLERLDAWRERGVRFRTRPLGRTSSGAALLVALGDERLASLGATLRFHGASLYRDGDVNAEVSAALHDKLTRANDRMVRRLVDRVLEGLHIPGEHLAQETDREVLEGMCMGAPPDRGGTAPARLQVLADALGKTVDNAIADGDRKSLAHIYGRLLQLDRPISPKLAATLGLLDGTVAKDGSSSRAHDTAPSCPTSSIPFASPEGAIARETLTRHVLVLGDDCTAASRHCLVPLVAALARAPEGEVGAVLVFDPVQELTGVLHNLASDRLQVLESNRIRLDLMAGDPSLAQTLETGQWVTAATAILVRTLDLVPGSPARVLVDVSGRVVDPVAREGTTLALSAIALVLMLTSRHSARPKGWLPDSDNARWLFSSLLDRVGCVDGERAPNVLATALWLLSTVSGYSSSRLAHEASQAFGRCPGEELALAAALGNGAHALSAADGHARAVLEVANAVLAPFATPETSTCLYAGYESGFDPDESLDFVDLVSGPRHARFLVVEPGKDASGGLFAAAVKLLYCEAVLAAAPRAGDGASLPLCGLIVRDFERHARAIDLAFLDSARSVRGFAVLASRSVSAIEHALRDVPRGEAIFPSVWSGAGTKVFLRSTDTKTQELARGLAPHRPGLPNVLDVRPLAGLPPDECYLCAPDGRFERRRLSPFTGAHSGDDGTPRDSQVLYLGLMPTDSSGGDAA